MPSRRTFILVLIASLCLCVRVAHAKDDGDDGWTRLGKVDFDNHAKEKEVVASILRGGWRFLRLKVVDADVKIDSVTVVFSSGRDLDLDAPDTIKAGKQSPPISLRGESRPLKKVKIKARSGDEGRKAVVEVWVKDTN